MANCCNHTDAPPSGTIELSLEAPDRGIFIICDESITLWQLGARFREFALALGFASESVDELIDPSVEEWAVEGRPVDDYRPGASPLCVNEYGCVAPLDCDYEGDCRVSVKSQQESERLRAEAFKRAQNETQYNPHYSSGSTGGAVAGVAGVAGRL